ncbi:MAG: hypothetical protein ACW99Q_12550, partial [Candidatus Kariarchaeaceae archaeon]
EIDQDGNILINDSIKTGSTFLGYNSDRNLNNYYSDNFKFLTYDTNNNTNKFQLEGIKIDLSNFYSTTTLFPSYTDTQSFTNMDFYSNFVNDLHEFKIRLLTVKEDSNNVSLCIGDFKTHIHTKTGYINYEEFESIAVQGRHVSDKIVMGNAGVELYGFSGFNMKEQQSNQKFRENFEDNQWSLIGTSQNTFLTTQNLKQATKVNKKSPDTNYDGLNLEISKDYETFFEIEDSKYLEYGETDFKTLRLSDSDDYVDDINSYLVNDFEEQSLTWNAKPDTLKSLGETSLYNQATSGTTDWCVPVQTLNRGSYDGGVGKLDEGPNPDGDRIFSYYGGNFEFRVQTPTFPSSENVVITGFELKAYSSAQIFGDWILYHDNEYVGSTATNTIRVWETFNIDLDDYIDSDNLILDFNLFCSGEFSIIDTIVIKFNYLTFTKKPYINLGSPTPGYNNYRLSASSRLITFSDNSLIYSNFTKYHQEPGFLYMQTNSTEFLKLRSPEYSHNTTLISNDKLVIEFKTTTSNNVNLTLLSDGSFMHNFTIVNEGNSDYTSQVAILTTNDVIQFDQLEFSGVLEEDYFAIYSIYIVVGDTESLETQVKSYNFVQDANKPHILPFTSDELTDSGLAQEKDNQYYNITSGVSGNEHYLSVEFQFNIPKIDMLNVEKIELQLEGIATSISLSDADFKYYNFSTGQYVSVTPAINNDKYTFLLEDSPNDISYTILFVIELSSSTPFTIHIDSINVLTKGLWTIQYDLYHASFKFNKLIYPQTGNISVSVSPIATVTMSDKAFLDTEENLISFYYDFNKQRWFGYFNNEGQPILNVSDTNPTFMPRIEGNYSTSTQGIRVTEIKSNYYLEVENSYDFEKYKSMIVSFKDKFNFAGIIKPNSLTTSENLFSQVSSDIDIIYNFNNDIVPNNIYNAQLNPTFTQEQFDNLGSVKYNETGFFISTVPTKQQYYVSSTYGNATITGPLTNLNTTDGNNVNFDSSLPELIGSTDWLVPAVDISSRALEDDKGNGNGILWDDLDDTWPGGDGNDIDRDPPDRPRYVFNVSTPTFPSGRSDLRITGIEAKIRINAEGDIELYSFDSDSSQRKSWSTGMTWYDFSLPYSHTIGTGMPNLKFQLDVWEDTDFPWFETLIDTIYIRFIYATDFHPVETGFNFNNYLDGKNDFYIESIGTTDGHQTSILINNITKFDFESTISRYSGFVDNIQSIKFWIENSSSIDYLIIELLNQSINFNLKNRVINLTSTLSKPFQSIENYGVISDPHFGTSARFTLENSILTPLFGRKNGLAYTNIDLSDLILDFDVYPIPDLIEFPLENINVEGNNETKFDPDLLKDYSIYSNSRFKNSAIDDIQIPLVTPVELDFGDININDYQDASL